MSIKKGFTLIELVVVLIIVAIGAAIMIPNFVQNIQQASVNATRNNLMTIYNAQQNYFLNNGTYCIGRHGTSSPACLASTGDDSCAGSLPAINCNMSLNITDSYFTYRCSRATGFTCHTTNIADPNLILTISDNPIILPNGSGCTTSTGANPTCNPSCQTDGAIYCPS